MQRSGRVALAGACCEDAPEGHPNPHHHEDPLHAAAQAAASQLASDVDDSRDCSYAARHDLDVQYYGVVSQSRSGLPSDGCYLLKTVQQRDRGACQCMHYALMRVCKGTGLAEQVRQYWV